MSVNLPILYQNIMLGFGSELGRDAFLWATERPGNDPLCYAAERFAHEVETFARRAAPMLAAAWRLHAAAGRSAGVEVRRDLEAFMLTRWANYRFGGNLSPAFAEGGFRSI